MKYGDAKAENPDLVEQGVLSDAQLDRYLAEFDFRHNNRAISDAERAEELLRGAKGKRLTYQQPREAANA